MHHLMKPRRSFGWSTGYGLEAGVRNEADAVNRDKIIRDIAFYKV